MPFLIVNGPLSLDCLMFKLWWAGKAKEKLKQRNWEVKELMGPCSKTWLHSSRRNHRTTAQSPSQPHLELQNSLWLQNSASCFIFSDWENTWSSWCHQGEPAFSLSPSSCRLPSVSGDRAKAKAAASSEMETTGEGWLGYLRQTLPSETPSTGRKALSPPSRASPMPGVWVGADAQQL